MKSQLPFSDKKALITGGSRGLGRAMVKRLAADGADVFFSYRSNHEAAQNVVKEVESAGGQAHAIQADGSNLAGIKKLYDDFEAQLLKKYDSPRFDFLIPNAGIISPGEIDDVSEEAFDQIFNLNVKGVFFTIQRGLSLLNNGGRIITLGTGLTRFMMTEYIAYIAAKGAIDTFTKALALKLGPRGITVNTLAPGAIDTDMNPWLKTPEGIESMRGMTALDRVGHAEDIADAAAMLLSKDARWITAQRIEASGGMKL